MSSTETDRSSFTGDRENYKQAQAYYLSAQQNENVSADGLLIAAAMRAGLAELAVEVSSIRGFGINQASNRR